MRLTAAAPLLSPGCVALLFWALVQSSAGKRGLWVNGNEQVRFLWCIGCFSVMFHIQSTESQSAADVGVSLKSLTGKTNVRSFSSVRFYQVQSDCLGPESLQAPPGSMFLGSFYFQMSYY